MKKLSLAFLAVAGILLSMVAVAQLSRSTLSGAVNAGMAKATVRGIGGSSGDSIKVDVRKTAKGGSKPLELSVPPGTKLSCTGEAQDMVVSGVQGEMTGGGSSYRPTSEIELDDYNTHTYLLRAYCMNFEKDNPSSSSRYTLHSADSTLACILTEAEKRDLFVQATQAAVWIYTDDLTFDHMNEKFPVSRSDWTKAQSVVKHCRSRKQ